MATFRMRSGLRKSDQNPHSSRSLRVRFGARWRARRRTISCCLSRRFSAITARTPPGPHSFAVVTARCSRVSRKPFMCARQRRADIGRRATLPNPGFGARIGNSRRTSFFQPTGSGKSNADLILANDRSRVALHVEVLALRHQLQVLQRARPRRLRLMKADR